MLVKKHNTEKILLAVLLPLFLILQSGVVKGQAYSHIKKLTDSLNIVSSATKKVDLYNKLSFEYIRISTDTFFLYNNLALEISEKTSYKEGTANAFFNLGKLYFYLDSFPQAKNNYVKALNLYNALNDSSKLRVSYYSLAETHYFLANFDSAQYAFQKSYDVAKDLNDVAKMAKALKQVGKMQWVKGEYAESLRSYNTSLPLAEAANDTGLICVLYNNIGIIYFGVGDYEKALENYYKALSLRDTLQDYKGKSLTLNNIGMVYSEWGKHQEAYRYYSHAATLSDSVYYLGGKAYSYYNLGSHYFNQNKLKLAIDNFKKALNTYIQDNSDIIGMYICYAKLGKIYQELNNLDSALIFFQLALDAANKMKGRDDKAGANYYLGNLYLKKGEIDKALEYAIKSDKILQQTDFKKTKQLNYALFSEIYKMKKNYKKALEYYILSNQYKDSIFNEEKTKQITKMEVLYRIEQKEQENEFLKREQERQKAKLEADSLTIRLQRILVGVASLLLIMVIAFTFIFYKEKQKLKAANNTKNKLFSIISHDLRGPMGNFRGLIDLLLMDVANNEQEKVNSLLKMMQKTATLNHDLLENLLSWSRAEGERIDFNPENLQLQELVNYIFEHYSYNAETKSIKLINNVNEEICIYADEYMMNTILRNLISNAIKFTKNNGKILVNSKEITVKNKKQVQISVEDTGVGMTQETAQKIFESDEFVSTRGTAKEKGTGLGLKLCKDFVKTHNGEIFVNSKLGEGTKIIFTVPACNS